MFTNFGLCFNSIPQQNLLRVMKEDYLTSAYSSLSHGLCTAVRQSSSTPSSKVQAKTCPVFKVNLQYLFFSPSPLFKYPLGLGKPKSSLGFWTRPLDNYTHRWNLWHDNETRISDLQHTKLCSLPTSLCRS